MAEINRELKRRLGAILVKLKKHDSGFTQDERQLAKVLEGKGMTKFFGQEQGPKIMSVTDYASQGRLAAMSHYILTGVGEEFVLQHTEAQLLAGWFLLPGETAWHDRWPWKLVWPAIVSVVTTLTTTLILYAIKGSGSK